MEYITIDKDKVKKYNVSFNNDVIINLKNKVINECSYIEHDIFEDNYYPFAIKNEDFEYRNIISLSRDNDINDNLYKFRYEYDKYTYPYLVKLINRLLSDDIKAIEEIFHFNGLYDFYIVNIESEINDVINELNDDNIDIDDKINKTDKLKELFLKKKKILLSDKLKQYYIELQDLISFELINEIEFSDYQRVEYFLDLDYKFNDNVYRYKK